MACRRVARIPHQGGAGQSGLDRRLRRWLARELAQLEPTVAESGRACAADRYRKHFTAYQHTCLLLFHGLARLPSLRQSHAAFGQCAGLAAVCGLAVAQDAPEGTAGRAVSYSQFAASNTSRPPAFLAGVFVALLARVARLGPRARAHAPPAALCALDSTFFRVCLKLAPWLHGGGGPTVSAVRVQVEYTPARDLPEHVLVGTTRTNDCRGFDAAILDDPGRLAALATRTLLFDLGFYSHQRMARLRAAGVHFVTRLHPQARYAVREDRPLQPPLPDLGATGRVTVTADQRVQLGSPNNRRGAVLADLRLVTAAVAARRGGQRQTYHLLTDRWDLSAAAVVQCYLWRWQIELFFRWLKRVIGGHRLLGYSPQACELTVWLALIVHLLCLLAADALGAPRRSPALLAQLTLLLALITPAEIAAASRPPPRQLPLLGLDAPETTAR